MWWIILGVVGWLACGVAGYLIIRRSFRVRYGPSLGANAWTTYDRMMGLLLCMVGPFGFLVAGGHWLCQVSPEAPAKW